MTMYLITDWGSAKCSAAGETGRTMDRTEVRRAERKMKKDSDGLINIADLTGCDTNALSLTAVLTILCLRK